MTRRIVSNSSGVAFPIAMPLPISRSVPPPRNEPTFGETPDASIARSQSPKLVQPLARSAQSPGGLLERSANGSVTWPATGEGVQPSPMISVVIPWVILERQRPSCISGTIACDWISMKPGQTTCPEASMTSAAAPAGICPARSTAAILSPLRATSPKYQGLPEPSTMRPPVITASNWRVVITSMLRSATNERASLGDVPFRTTPSPVPRSRSGPGARSAVAAARTGRRAGRSRWRQGYRPG